MTLSILFILLITIGIGLPLSLFLLPKQNSFILFGSAFPLGIGVFTLLMFVGNIIGVRFSTLNEILLFVSLSIPVIILCRNKLKKHINNLRDNFKKQALMPVEKVLLIIMIFLVATSLINTLFWPVHIWDSLTLYDIRGKIFATTGFMKEAWFSEYYWGYPLLTSLSHTIVYLFGGKYPQFIYSLFYMSMALSLYGALREFVSRRMSMICAVMLLVTEPLFYHSLISLTNLPYTVYLFLAAIYVYLWDKKGKKGYLVLSALFAGLSTWTRSVEPFWMGLLLVVFIVSIYRKNIWNAIIYLAILFPIREAWLFFKNTLFITTTTSSPAHTVGILSLFDFGRWGDVLVFFYKNIIIPWGPIFIAFLLSSIFIFMIKKQKKFILIFLITFVFLGAIIGGTFVFSLSFKGALNLGDSAQRLSMLFYPLFVYCVGLVLGEIYT